MSFVSLFAWAVVSPYRIGRRSNLRMCGGLGNPPSGYGLQNHPRTKAVDVLTLLLIIIVLLLLFGGWGYSRRGRRI
jgi:hypothetical protein